MKKAAEKPALLGGPKAFPEALPRYISTGPRETQVAMEVLESGILSDFVGGAGPFFMGGKHVRELEEAWAAHFGVKHALSVNSATSGLHAAVVAAGVHPGDEVIVPPQTMSATATAIVMAGGTPVFVDQEQETCCLDPEAVKHALSPRTKAILAVNLFGGPAQQTHLREIADQNGIILIEDNAQAPGGKHRNQWLGTIGHLGVFSLNCHKAIQCGEGGMVVTSDDRLARRVALVRNHGENVVEANGWLEDADILGYNYRMTEPQAAVAKIQLERLEALTHTRLEIAHALDDGLAQFDVLRTARVNQGDKHVYYVYPIWLDPGKTTMTRDSFVKALLAEGCPVTGRYIRPLYHLPLFQKLRKEGKAIIADPSERCPNAEKAYSQTLLYTTLIQVPGGLTLVERFVHAVERVLSHADLLNS